MRSTPPAGFEIYGAEILLNLCQQLNREIDGVRADEDIECVHRMRVASRRIRAALSIYDRCLKPREFKNWRKIIRRVTRSLGAARDADVQIQFLSTYIKMLGDKKFRFGLERLLLRLKQERHRLQRGVEKAMGKVEKNGALENMIRVLREQIVRARLKEEGEVDAEVIHDAGLAIFTRLEELLAYEPFVHQPDEQEAHHAMRIAAKRLRYTMEFWTRLYNHELDPFLKSLKKIQSLLGDLHDADVWIEKLPVFLDQERERTLRYLGHTRPMQQIATGIQHLQNDRQREREVIFGEFASQWKKLRNCSFWGKLRDYIQSRNQPGEDLPPQAATGSKQIAGVAEPEPEIGGHVVETDPPLEKHFEEEEDLVSLGDPSGTDDDAAEAATAYT